MILRGCYGGAKFPTPLVDGSSAYTCPVRLADRARHYAREFVFYKRGQLPNPGTYAQQPAKFIDAMETLEQWLNKNLKEDLE